LFRRRQRPNIAAQKGTAIIVALFVMSIVAVASVAMIVRLHIDIRRTELLLNSDRAYLYAQGSIAWASDQLFNNFKNQKPNQLVDKMPIESKADETDGFLIQSTIYDAQGFFNVNNLAAKDSQNDFLQLMKAVLPQLEPATAKKISMSIHDWITIGSKDSTADAYYAANNPPYSSAHHLMVSVSELRLVQGMTSALYTQLLPFLIALPETTAINVNNASNPVLMSLNPNLSAASAKMIETYRKQTPFTTPQKFQDFDIVKNNPIAPAKITVTSNYFLVKTSVKVGQQQTILYTLLKRTVEKSKPAITVLWQTKGTL
jgi:general secretion pathway protein K